MAMTLNTIHVQDGDYIRTDISGDLTQETAAQASREARRLAEQTGSKKFLVNMMNARDLFSTS